MTEPTYVVTGRGARIKHMVIGEEVMCPSEASTPATGAAANKPLCSRCETNYAERQQGNAEAAAQDAAAEEPQTEHKELALPDQIQAAMRLKGELSDLIVALRGLDASNERDQVLKTVGKSHDEAEATLSNTANLTVKGAASLIEDLSAAERIGWDYLTAQTQAALDAEKNSELEDGADGPAETQDDIEETVSESDAQPEPEVPTSRNGEEVEVHFSARVTSFMAEELKGVHPNISSALAEPRLERCGRGFTAYVKLPRDHANILLLQLKALLEELNTGKREKGTKGGMNFQPEAVAKGIQHITADLAA